jgi:hypothetical protein
MASRCVRSAFLVAAFLLANSPQIGAQDDSGTCTFGFYQWINCTAGLAHSTIVGLTRPTAPHGSAWVQWLPSSGGYTLETTH